MGADVGLEASAHGGGLGTVHSRRDLSYLCGGWIAHGDHIRDLLWLASRLQRSAVDHRPGPDPDHLVLRRAHWLARIGDPGDGYADDPYYRLGYPSSRRINQLLVRSRVA